LSTDCVDDAELVSRARDGDHAAFGALVDRHRHAVYRAALAVLRSHADAEDAAQEAFVKAYRRLAGFRGDSSFKTWLLTIAWREAINKRRTLNSIWRHVIADRGLRMADSSDDRAIDVAATDPNPEEMAHDNQLRQHITAAVDALTPKLRDVFLPAQSGEHSYEEIGAIVGAPVGTIKWRVSEARRVVKQFLRQRGYAHVG